MGAISSSVHRYSGWEKAIYDQYGMSKKFQYKTGQTFFDIYHSSIDNRVAPDTELAGYPANLFFCRISGIRPDIRSGRISGLIVKGFHKKTKQLTFFSITFTVFNILV